MENRRKSRKSLHDVNRDLSIPIRRQESPQPPPPTSQDERDEEKELVEQVMVSTATFDAEIAQWEKIGQLAAPLASAPPPPSASVPDKIEKLFELERQLKDDMANQSEQRKRENLLDMWQVQAEREKENFAKLMKKAEGDYGAYVAQFNNNY